MIRQYLSNTNEIGTIHILQNILELNKAWSSLGAAEPALLSPNQQHMIAMSIAVEALEPVHYNEKNMI